MLFRTDKNTPLVPLIEVDFKGFDEIPLPLLKVLQTGISTHIANKFPLRALFLLPSSEWKFEDFPLFIGDDKAAVDADRGAVLAHSGAHTGFI